MIKKHNLIVVFIAIVVSAAIWLNAFHRKTKNNISVKALTFQVVNGWGYNILVNDSVFIHQANIPVINGTQGFAKKEQAEKTAQLIINKIKRGETPVVSIFELQKIISITDYQHDGQEILK